MNTLVVNNIKAQIVKYAPEILTGLGVVGAVGSAVLACKATLKVNDILDEAKDSYEKINSVENSESFKEEYSKEDALKDRAIVTIQTAVKLMKLYGPAILLGAVSLGLIVKSNGILRSRNTNLAAAYVVLKEGYDGYRKRVIERYGEDAEKEIRYQLNKAKIEDIVVDEETRKEKKVKKTVWFPDCLGEYGMIFDEKCTSYNKSLDYNMMFLKSEERYANDLLKSRGYLFLNDIYERLGVYDRLDPETKKQKIQEGHTIGWVYNEDNPKLNNYVDFKINEYYYSKNYADIPDDLYEPIIMLDFNPDGPVLNLI